MVVAMRPNRSGPDSRATKEASEVGRCNVRRQERTDFEQTRRHLVRPVEKIMRELRRINPWKVDNCVRARALTAAY